MHARRGSRQFAEGGRFEGATILFLAGDPVASLVEQFTIPPRDAGVVKAFVCERRTEVTGGTIPPPTENAEAFTEWRGHVTEPKGGRIRYLPLTARLAAALRQHRHLRGLRVLVNRDGHSFTQEMPGPWQACTLWHAPNFTTTRPESRVVRLMRRAGVRGVSRRKWIGTTVRNRAARPASDLVQRAFTAAGPNQLWVADITYVSTLSRGGTIRSGGFGARV